MAINKKLIHFKTKTAFTTELDAGNILNTSIVFIKDTKEIWTHGQLYSCSSLTEEEINSIIEKSPSISTLTQAVDLKVDKVDGKQLSTNDYTTDEKNKLAEALDESAANALINTAIGKLTKASVGLGNVTNDSQVKRSEMGTVNGVATLDEQGHVPTSQLPSYVDDVVDVYATYTKDDAGALTDIKVFSDSDKTQPVTGESGKIYIDVENNSQFRWTGTKYAPVGAPTVIGEIAGTAYDGGKGKAIADKINEHVTKTDNPHGVTKAQVGLGNVDNTSDKLKPISDATREALGKKVDSVDGKSLTSNDFTDALKNKLDGIAENANNYSLPTASATKLGGVIVDTELDSTSTNPVQNSAVKSAIDEINGKLSWAKIE